MIEIAQKDNPFFEEGYKYKSVSIEDFNFKKVEKSIEEIIKSISSNDFLDINFYNREHTINEIKTNYKDGDIIYLYESPDWTWMKLCGRAGIKIIRDNKEIFNKICVLN